MDFKLKKKSIEGKSGPEILAREVLEKTQTPEPPKPEELKAEKKPAPRPPRRSSAAGRAKASAGLANTMFFSLCRTVGGPDASPTDKEVTELNEALADYLLATGKTDISPAWVVAGLYSKFLLEKTFKPSVKARLRAGVEFMRMNVRGRVRKLLKKRPKPVAQPIPDNPAAPSNMGDFFDPRGNNNEPRQN